MIIVSKNYKNCKANFSNVEVEFDGEFKTKVTSELGSKILKSFPDEFWEEGRKPEIQVKKEEVVAVDNEKLVKLQNEIERLNGIIRSKEGEISQAKEGEQAWRDAYSKLEKSKSTGLVINEGGAKIEETKTETENVLDENKELVEEMSKKNFLQLKKWVKDTFKKTDEDIKDYLDKEKLIQFVLSLE